MVVNDKLLFGTVTLDLYEEAIKKNAYTPTDDAPQCWGDHVTLVCLATKFNVRVVCLRSDGGQSTVLPYGPTAVPGRTVYLAFHAGESLCC